MKTAIGWILPVYSVMMLALVFTFASYSWPAPKGGEELATTEPAATNFPESAPDFKVITDIAERKQAFFDFLRPMIQEQNRILAKQRAQLLEWQAKIDAGDALGPAEQAELLAMGERFALEEGAPEELVESLLLRVNTIPEAMALAQAASESAWGTSRFARKGNNFFGQWCYSEGCGLVPNRRLQGAAHEVAVFNSPYESVEAYFRNINTHRAYRELRQLRQQRALAEQPLTAQAILPGLRRYSERGEKYIEELREIIRYNKLAIGNKRSQE